MQATRLPKAAMASPERGCGPWAALALPAALSLCFSLWPARTRAAGFAIPEQSPLGTGLAVAVAARPDDPSAIFYNPAGLGFQNGLQTLAGASLVFAQQHATLLDPSSPDYGKVYYTQPGIFFLPTLYVAARVHDRISIGIGAFASHGLTIDWQNPDNPGPFPGRFKVLRIGLQTFTMNPTITVRPIPEFAIGAGLDIVLAAAELSRALMLAQDAPEGKVALSGRTQAVGANFGALVRLLDGRLNLGLAYRMAINLHFGDMKVGTTAPPGVAFDTPFTQAQTDVQIPHTIDAGVAFKPMNWLTVSLDFIATLWGGTQKLTLYLESSDGQQILTQEIPRYWNDTYSGRLGLEADFRQALPGRLGRWWPKLRFGVGYDQTPIPANTLDPSLPDADRVLVSAGLSLGLRGLGSFDVGFIEALFKPRTATNRDVPTFAYNSSVHVLTAGMTVQLGRKLTRRSHPFAGRLLEPTEPPPTVPPPHPPS